MNRNNIKNEVEKSLKRFLKDKVKITTSLLVGFLISGGLAFGSSTNDLALQTTVTQEDLLNKIAMEKSEIQALIDANEARLRALNRNEFELVRKGDFYSKSVYESSQVLFPIIIENSGKMRNRTNERFEETFDAAKKYYAGNGYSLDINGDVAGKYPIPGLTPQEAAGLSYDEQIALLLKKGQGVLPKINTPDIVLIDLGVNIQLLTPEIPIINVNAEVSTPEVDFPILTTPTIPNVAAPVTPTIPSAISVTVETPTPIAGVNVAEPIITEPQIPQERDLAVATPQAPGAFDPLMIIPPDPPSTPVVNIPNTPIIEIHVVSNGNGYEVSVDNPYGNNSVISHVGVTAGEFYIKRNDNFTVGPGDYWDNYWEYKYDNYDVINIGSMTSSGDIILAAPSSGTFFTLSGLTTSGVYKLSGQGQRGFMRQLEQFPTYTNAKFVISRAIENSSIETDEFVHMDMHGGTSAENVADRLTEAATISGKNIEVLGAWNDIVTNLQAISNQSTYSVMANSGSIYLEGGNLSLNNMYDHTGSGKNIFMNTGNVILQPYNEGGTIYGGQNAVFVVSADLSGIPHDIMYNGETGKIDVYTKDSVGYIIDSGYTSSYGQINLHDYSNRVWNTWDLNPTGGSPQVYDVSGSNTYYPTYDQLFQWYFSNPYGITGSNIPVYSTINRGNFNLHGSGSAGIYIKNAGDNGYMTFAKDTRGSVTPIYDIVGVDCSVNGGVTDWATYPTYGFPIVVPAYQLSKTYYPNGYPDDYTTVAGGGNIDIQFVKEDGITPAPLKIYGDKSVGLYLGGTAPKTYDVYEYDMSTGTGGLIDTFTAPGGIGNVTGKLYVDLGDSLGSGNKTYTSNPANTQGSQITNDPL
ncbi:MAG: autotransporter-associated N-terminal domain-containing protein, partial [Fusobacteriaceae bacterium]|nr:autotransporter-associated N-terminal domain-containing protein [Fusobacteriaceae bacterium]